MSGLDGQVGGLVPRWLFLRGLGLVALAAFASLWSQVMGLAGSQGIVPAEENLARAATYYAEQGLWKWAQAPTLGWWAAGDTALHVFCGLGCLAAIGLLVGLAPRLMLLVAWVLYLTLFHMVEPFLGFQWDILLLETLLVAIPYAPAGVWPRLADQAQPHRLAVWLVRLLLFKLIVSSGVVKLTSGDPAWSELEALSYHYWTQPLPHALAWHAHTAPEWTQTLGVAVTFLVELILPLLIVFQVRGWRLVVFGAAVGLVGIGGEGRYTLDQVPWLAALALLLDDRFWQRVRPVWIADERDARWPAFIGIVGLMLAITATGSYGFFPLLTAVLCLPLLDDMAVRRLPLRGPGRPEAPGRFDHGLAIAFAVVILPVSALQMVGLAREKVPESIGKIRDEVLEVTRPFASINSYGLFATMTKQRIEIVVEGSADGRTDWKPYVFEYKPDSPEVVASWAGLHMPRLDWQMWFAALSPQCRQGWYVRFVHGLLRGSPTVHGLLAAHPFPDRPPLAIRSRRLEYTFTDPRERAASGRVWRVRPAGQYCPVLTRALLEEGR